MSEPRTLADFKHQFEVDYTGKDRDAVLDFVARENDEKRESAFHWWNDPAEAPRVDGVPRIFGACAGTAAEFVDLLKRALREIGIEAAPLLKAKTQLFLVPGTDTKHIGVGSFEVKWTADTISLRDALHVRAALEAYGEIIQGLVKAACERGDLSVHCPHPEMLHHGVVRLAQDDLHQKLYAVPGLAQQVAEMVSAYHQILDCFEKGEDIDAKEA